MIKMRVTNHGKDDYVILDDEDYEYLKEWKWHIDDHGYARRTASMRDDSGKRHYRVIRMHREILGIIGDDTKQLCVDHINGNRLDNRKENLRIVTYSENGSNRHVIKSSTGILRVSKTGDRFLAQMTVNKKQVYLGTYHTADDAARAVDAYTEQGVILARKHRAVRQLAKDGRLLATYPHCTDAGKATGVCVSCISSCASGKRRSAGGYKWEYVS